MIVMCCKKDKTSIEKQRCKLQKNMEITEKYKLKRFSRQEQGKWKN